ncbi:hypothetical protein [Roseateles sp. P5_E4]
MAVLISALLDTDAMAFATEPAMLGVSARLEQALTTHLDDATGSVDIPLQALVGDADSLIMAQMLLAQLPPGLACLGARDTAGGMHEGDDALSTCASGRGIQAVFYRFDLALLRSRLRPLKAAG